MRHVKRRQEGRRLVCLRHSRCWTRKLIIEWGRQRWGVMDLMSWKIVRSACRWRGTGEVGAGSGSGHKSREEL